MTTDPRPRDAPDCGSEAPAPIGLKAEGTARYAAELNGHVDAGAARSDLGDSASHDLLGALEIRTPTFPGSNSRAEESAARGRDRIPGGLGSDACFPRECTSRRSEG
jgi:hypothetical protein